MGDVVFPHDARTLGFNRPKCAHRRHALERAAFRHRPLHQDGCAAGDNFVDSLVMILGGEFDETG